MSVIERLCAKSHIFSNAERKCLVSLSLAMVLLFLLTHSSDKDGVVSDHRNSHFRILKRDEISIGTIVRGDEWKNADSDKKKAVSRSLLSLSRWFGDENVVILADKAEACDTLPDYLSSARCGGLEHCMYATYGKPTMDCIFSTLWRLAKGEIVGFINADILVFESFVKSIVFCASNYDEFVMVGRRHLSEIPMPIPTSVSGLIELEARSKSLPLDGGAAIDYFVTRRSAFSTLKDFPPFIVGVYRWDNFLLMKFYKEETIVVIDATKVAPVVHQVFNDVEDHESRPAAGYNNMLASNNSDGEYVCGTIDNANVVLLTATQGSYKQINVNANYTC